MERTFDPPDVVLHSAAEAGGYGVSEGQSVPPLSMYDNIAYGPQDHGIKERAKLDEIVERFPAGGGTLG